MWYLARKIGSVLFTMVLTYPAMSLNVCCHLSTMELNGSGVLVVLTALLNYLYNPKAACLSSNNVAGTQCNSQTSLA